MIPTQMLEAPRWILWRLEQRDNQPTKVPYNAKTFHHAKTNDPSTWCDYATAEAALKSGGNFTGLGFVLGDGFAGVDIDGCMTGNDIQPWAWSIIRTLESYSEVSPSGTGVKIFLLAGLERGRKKLMGSPLVEGGKAPGLEIYGGGRYFAVTGEEIGISDDCEERQEQLDALIAEHWPERKAVAPVVVSRPAKDGRIDVVERARRYMEQVDPSVSGQRGHDVAFRGACALVLGFGLSTEEALPLFAEWNQKCLPPWSEKELQHKLDSANKQGGERGYLLRDDYQQQVDLSQFLLVTKEEIPASVAYQPYIEEQRPKLPDDVLCPPGFLGKLVEHNLRTAWFQQPELALAGALAMLATLTGGKVADQNGTRTNLYLLGLGLSRCGKDHARKLNREIAIRAGVENILGPEGIKSDAAIWSWLADEPTLLFQIDEIGRTLATMQDAKGSPHLWAIIGVWLKLWSCSDSMLKSDAYADRSKTKTLMYPHAVIYGTSVPEAVWGSLTHANVSDGLLSRFLIFEGRGYETKPNISRLDEPVPDSLIEIARAWRELKTHDGNLASLPSNAKPVKLLMDIEAQQRWVLHNSAVIERRSREDQTVAAVWSGTPEKTSKLAILFAASRWAGADRPLPVIELEDMDRAVTLANYLTRLTLDRAGTHVADNQTERDANRVLQVIRDAGEATLTTITRATRRLRPRERKEILETLIQAELVGVQTRETKGRHATVFCAIGESRGEGKHAQANVDGS